MLPKLLLLVYIVACLLVTLGGICLINESRSYCFMCGTKMFHVKTNSFRGYVCPHCEFFSDTKWHNELLTKITESKRKILKKG